MGYLSELIRDPRTTLIVILLAMPGRMLAMSLHEYAHARVAYKCGDDTAAMLGRMTINPLKHIDVLGFLMLYLVGFGWAKPVPVNPRNFKGDFRKCDLKVSLAGITMNLILFLASGIVLYGVIGVALSQIPTLSGVSAYFGAARENMYIAMLNGEKCLFMVEEGYLYQSSLSDVLRFAPYAGEFLIKPLWGVTPYYLFEMLSYFVQINLVLAVFNLLPLPPLDGYHVLNDLVLKRDLFASPRAAQITSVIMLALLFTGVLGRALGFVIDGVFFGAGSALGKILQAVGVI